MNKSKWRTGLPPVSDEPYLFKIRHGHADSRIPFMAAPPMSVTKMVNAKDLFPGERDAIHQALSAGARFGYGNVMAWLATAWAVNLRDREGMEEDTAIQAASIRGPYRLPPPAKSSKQSR